MADFGHKLGKGFGKRAAHPHSIFLGEYPPGDHRSIRWVGFTYLRQSTQGRRGPDKRFKGPSTSTDQQLFRGELRHS